MNTNKYLKILINNKYRIIISLVALISCIFISLNASDNISKPKLKKVGYIYNNNKLVVPVVDTKEQKTITKNLSTKKETNIKYEESSTLLDYKVDTTFNAPNYVKEEAQNLEKGYALQVDDKTYYVPNKDYLNYLEEKIYNVYIKNKDAYEQKIALGKFTPYQTEDNKTITDVQIENKISINEALIPTDEKILSEEELFFELFHQNDEKKYYTVQPGDDIASICQKNNISEDTFLLDNPQYEGYPILSEQSQVIVNDLNPTIQVALYQKQTKEEPIEYSTKYEKTKKLEKGTEKTKQKGVNGLENVVYQEKIINGEKVSVEEVSHEVIKQAVDEIILKGIKEPSASSDGSSSDGSSSDSSDSAGVYSAAAGSASIIWPMDSHSISCGLGCYPGHTGIDITGPYGANVYSATSGQVIYSQYSPYGGGNEVRIYSGGTIYVYAHMTSAVQVSVGQSVSQGQTIGFMGSSGNVSGPHLHFEMRAGASSSNPFSGTVVNPRAYLP